MRQLLFLFASTAIFFSACNESVDKPVPDKVDSAEKAEDTDADFVGLSEKDAEALAGKRGLKHRVVEREGEMLPATRDLRQDRLNFIVKDGKVTKVSRG